MLKNVNIGALARPHHLRRQHLLVTGSATSTSFARRRGGDRLDRLPGGAVVRPTTNGLRRASSMVTLRQRRHRSSSPPPPVPGNERAVNETIDRLYYLGCEVVTAREAPVHTSGHGHREELKLMLNLTRPRYLMPVHGDHKRLQLPRETRERRSESTRSGRSSARTASRSSSTRSGARFGEPRASRNDVRRRPRDRRPRRRRPIRDRRVLSRDGVVVLVATISQQDGELLGDPELIMRGVTQPGTTTTLHRQRCATPSASSLARAAQRAASATPSSSSRSSTTTSPTSCTTKPTRRPMILPSPDRALARDVEP